MPEAGKEFHDPDAQAEAWFWTNVIQQAQSRNGDRSTYDVKWPRKRVTPMNPIDDPFYDPFAE